MSARQLWQHRKGGLYWRRLARETASELYEGERVAVQLDASLILQQVLVTDDVDAGERFVLYTDAFPPHAHYLRPERLWEDGRFKKGSPDAQGVSALSEYGVESDAVMARILLQAQSGRRSTYWLEPHEMHLLNIRWNDPRLVREHTRPYSEMWSSAFASSRRKRMRRSCAPARLQSLRVLSDGSERKARRVHLQHRGGPAMNRQQRRQQARSGEIGEPNLPMPGEAVDTRVVYGAGCTYWGGIYSIKTIGMNGWPMPCCPHCQGMLHELPTEADYLTPADEHEGVDPGYGGFVRWNKGRECLSLQDDDPWGVLRAEYEAQRSAGLS